MGTLIFTVKTTESKGTTYLCQNLKMILEGFGNPAGGAANDAMACFQGVKL